MYKIYFKNGKTPLIDITFRIEHNLKMPKWYRPDFYEIRYTEIK